jgi:hypothetical protein
LGSKKGERVKGIEPSYAAWEAAVLPLNYTREEFLNIDLYGGDRKSGIHPMNFPLIKTGLNLCIFRYVK